MIMAIRDDSKSIRAVPWLLMMVIMGLVTTVAFANPTQGILSQPYISFCEQKAASIRSSRSFFESHIDTPYLADVIPRILATGGFIDRHASAMDAWAEEMRSKKMTNMSEIAYVHNGSAAYDQALFEIDVYVGRLAGEAQGLPPQSPNMFEELSPANARAMVIELADNCYFAPPGSTVAECRAQQRTQVRAAWPSVFLEGVYDDEAELELELLIENAGEHPAKEVSVTVQFGLAYIEVSSAHGICARGRPWVCKLGDLQAGDKKRLKVKVDVAAGDDPEVTETDRLIVTAYSAVTEWKPVTMWGGSIGTCATAMSGIAAC